MRLYADDAKLYFSSSDCKNLYDTIQADLERVARWTDEMQLNIAVKKCHVLRIRAREERNIVSYSIGAVQLPFVLNVRDLGFFSVGLCQIF